MADQLYLTYVLRGYTETNMIRHFEKMLRAFPFSRLSQTGVTLRINAISFSEPPIYEHGFEGATELEPVLETIREYQAPDCAATFDASWDLWQYEDDWKLAPARVSLMCFGPQFESPEGEHLRIDLGVDTRFLPQPALPNSMFMAQSNVRSLLHLVHDLDNQLAVETRRLWTESGENFADRLAEILKDQTPGPRLVKG